jgi:hypothetical protein
MLVRISSVGVGEFSIYPCSGGKFEIQVGYRVKIKCE